MLITTKTKLVAGLLVLAGIPLLLGINCLFAPPSVDQGSTDPVSTSVLGVVVSAGRPTVNNINVNILAGSTSIFGGPVAVPVPVNQDYDKTITSLAPHREIDIYSLLWSDGLAGGVRVYMHMVTTDALSKNQHTVSLHFSAWHDVGKTPNMWDAVDTEAAMPNGAGGSLDLSAITGNIVIGVDSIQFEDSHGTPLTKVDGIEADFTGPAEAPSNLGRSYSVYMKDAPLGRFYNLVGLEAAVASPDTTCISCFSARVPGETFFHNPKYGYNLDGGPFTATGLGGPEGDAKGEFEYTLMNPAFASTAARQVLIDPWNDGATTPIAPANLTPGSNKVHELAASCTFITKK
ncbi:MAG: hypothetical protein ACYTF1_09225 [Planctomycetota bacterium]|jgi:hypothetical protein